MFIVVIPAVFGVVPAIGLAVAKSRWTPLAWVIAVGAAATGYVLHGKGMLLDQRTFIVALSPLYQLAMYSLLLSCFVAIFREPPRYVPMVFIDNYIAFARSLRDGRPGDWGVRLDASYPRDIVFKAIVILTGVVPPLYGIYGHGNI